MSSVKRTERQSVDELFYRVILRFNLNDLKNTVPSAFDDDELTWELIKKAMLKYNLSTRKQDIARLLLEYTKTMETKELLRVYGNLLLIDLKLHSNKKTWSSINMRQESHVASCDDFVLNLSRNFQEKSKTLDVYSDVLNNIVWLVLIVNKKTKNNKIIQEKPVFIAHPLETTYVFYSPKRISANFLEVIIKSLGYSSYKVLKLIGKDIPSLISMLHRRKNADQLRARTSLVLKNTTDVIAVKSSRGIDFCQDKIRTAHAREILGNESIRLENLTVNANSEWRGLRTLPEAEGEKLDISMQLRSKDIRSSLEEMMKRGIISPPYPVWLKEFFISGKNALQIG